MSFYAREWRAGSRKVWSRILAVLAVAGLAILTEGCAAVAPLSSVAGGLLPTSTLGIYNTTELRLQQKNFVVVKPDVLGQSKGFSLLGIITIVPAPFTKAMNRLYAQADMRPGSSRALANLIMEKDSTYLILFSIPRTAIRADVIEFTAAASTNSPPEPASEENRLTTK